MTANMREACVHYPLVDNCGNDVQYKVEEYVNNLIQMFGGATVLTGTGAWMDGGVHYSEPVARVIIAIPDDHMLEQQQKRFFFEAVYNLRSLGQKAMYYRTVDGFARIAPIGDADFKGRF